MTIGTELAFMPMASEHHAQLSPSPIYVKM
jgi:hypothetical protein